MTPAKPEGIDPKYLKVSYLPPEGSLSRRDLLFGPLTPRYDIVPAVEAEACTAWKGCAQCLTACPQQAIAMDGSAAVIDKAKCSGCGACLPACPMGAIRQPLLDPDRLDADLRALLLGGENAPQPRILFLVADGGPPLEGSRSLGSLCLPSVGAVSTWLLLRAFTLGADAIVILPCRAGCRHRCDLARWEQTLRFTREVFARFGIEAERLLIVGREEAGNQLRFKAFAEALAALGPHRLGTRGGLKAKEALTLAELLQDLIARAPTKPAPLAGEGVPFGMVRVQAGRCTLCGACPDRCPTGALVLSEDADSSQLLFDHARCVACEACIRVCPEGAVEVERRLECSRLGSWAVLAEDEIVRCQRCRTSVAPKRMLRKVQSRLGRAAVTGRFCPSCQMLSSLAPVRE